MPGLPVKQHLSMLSRVSIERGRELGNLNTLSRDELGPKTLGNNCSISLHSVIEEQASGERASLNLAPAPLFRVFEVMLRGAHFHSVSGSCGRRLHALARRIQLTRGRKYRRAEAEVLNRKSEI